MNKQVRIVMIVLAIVVVAAVAVIYLIKIAGSDSVAGLGTATPRQQHGGAGDHWLDLK